ncbi:MAG: AmmeMemoRadiSam system protein B [Gammaproteobacteria bacterium]|nr:MAG: AmmeMemoRadiSam system protein B [Gammaproteobacteria bacterium]
MDVAPSARNPFPESGNEEGTLISRLYPARIPRRAGCPRCPAALVAPHDRPAQTPFRPRGRLLPQRTPHPVKKPQRAIPLLGLLCLLLPWGAFARTTAPVRPPAVAGSWYPADPQRLAAYIDDLLDRAAPPGETKGRVFALISPHAGYVFSGEVAAQGFRRVQGQSFRRVVVLGPAHSGGFHGLSIAPVSAYRTPLGDIPLDAEAIAALRRSPLVGTHAEAHREEHSIEMQLPFLQRALRPGWKLVPILVGRMEAQDYPAAAALLKPLLDDRTLLVVSSDFTHYGPRYRYRPFPFDERTPERLEQLDQGALAAILAHDREGLLRYWEQTGITICGLHPIAILLELIEDRPEIEGTLLKRDTSGRITGDYRTSVSYLSILFRDTRSGDDPRPDPAPHLSDSDMRLLHRIATAAVTVAARPGDEQARKRLQGLLEQVPEHLQRPAGVFVTLTEHGRLRGCIGYIEPRKPLVEAMAENGIHAARDDWRFPPLRPEELNGLEIEISVLTPLRPIDSYHDFRVGEDGIVLEKNGRSAVFLPEVAKEFGWTREQTLSHLARKAGLPENAWKNGARFKVFRTQVYKAPYAE